MTRSLGSQYDDPGQPRGSSFGTSTAAPRTWRDDAKCQGVALDQDYNPFWDDTITRFEAELLCAGCPVKNQCVDDARFNGGYGVRGGMVEAAWR